MANKVQEKSAENLMATYLTGNLGNMMAEKVQEKPAENAMADKVQEKLGSSFILNDQHMAE